MSPTFPLKTIVPDNAENIHHYGFILLAKISIIFLSISFTQAHRIAQTTLGAEEEKRGRTARQGLCACHSLVHRMCESHPSQEGRYPHSQALQNRMHNQN